MLFLLVFVILSYECVCVCGYVLVRVCARGALGQVAISHLTWELGLTLGSSGRAANIPNSWAVPSAQISLNWFYHSV